MNNTKNRPFPFSGIIFDHCQYPLRAFKGGTKEVCAVFGQTCDGLDCISQSDLLPDLEIDDLVYAKTSAPTAAPRRPTSTASRRRKLCM